jgi:gliding motility associated protien GldN
MAGGGHPFPPAIFLPIRLLFYAPLLRYLRVVRTALTFSIHPRKSNIMFIRSLGLPLALALLLVPVLPAQDIGSSASGSKSHPTPVVDIVDRRAIGTRSPLAHPPVREADLLWEKRVWRVIDVREKLNQPFAYPERPLYAILTEAIHREEIAAYTDDRFRTRLSPEGLRRLTERRDTIQRYDMCGFRQDEPYIILNVLSADQVKRYRLLEQWYFDTQRGELQARILGIAPLREEYDEMGNLLYELPLFWIYFPAARSVLAREPAYAEGSASARRSWEDVFVSRFFSSYIYREDNAHDGYQRDHLSGRDLLREADRIDRAVFDFAGYLWSY